MSDLVGGKYPQLNAAQVQLGLPSATAQTNIPVRSNTEFPFASGTWADTAAALTTQVMTAVPVPVEVGQVITNISVLVGNTAGSTFTNSWAALYSGTTVASPPLIAQTPDGAGTPANGTQSTRLDFTFTTPQVITAAQAPYGYVWAAIMVKGTVCSLITAAVPAAVGQYRYFTNTPLYACQTAGSSLTTTAPATLINASTKTTSIATFVW